MPSAREPWVIALVTGLAATTGGLALFLLSVIVEEIRQGHAERAELRHTVREHVRNERAHGADVRPRFPPAWRAP